MERIQRAILLNVPIFLLYFLCYIILLLILYVLDQNNSNYNILNTQGIIAIGVAMAIAGGLFLLVCFLGYGLVKIPVQMWVQSDYEAKLNRIYFKLGIYEDRIIEQQNKV